jgi:RHS repeat-associated protein
MPLVGMGDVRVRTWLAFGAALLSWGFGETTARAQAGGRTAIVPGGGDPRSAAVGLFTGSLSERIGIEPAPSRRNFKPRFNLAYSSLGAMTDLGFGWQIDVGKIERSTKNGVPKLTDDDLIQFSVGGISGELVAVAGGFRARVEAQFRTFVRSGAGWIMTDPAGTTYRFGSTEASRVMDATGTVPVVWQLDGIEDLNGNLVALDYIRDGNVLYLKEVRYAGHAPSGETGNNLLVFDYQARPDTTSSYLRGARQDRGLRLFQISAFSGSSLVRRYQLGYGQSPANNRSLLQGILLVGADDTATYQSRLYTYQDRPRTWSAEDAGALPRDLVDADGRDTGLRIIDVDGDNYADLVVNGTDVLLGDGQGGFASDPVFAGSMQAASVRFVGDDGIDGGVRLLDVNSDLRPDLVIATSSRREVLLNTGSGWVHDDAFSASLDGLTATIGVLNEIPNPDGGAPTDTFEPTDVHISLVSGNGDANGVVFADVNGDGKPDIVWSNTSTGGFDGFGPNGDPIRLNQVDIRTVYLNTGSGWARDANLSAGLAGFALVVNSQLQGYDLLDVNGDGISDMVRTLGGAAREVFLGTGTGWTRDTSYSDSLAAAPLVSLDADRKNQGLLPVDFDGDGLLDYLRSGGGVTTAYRNTGSGWALAADVEANLVDLGIVLADGEGSPTGVGLADIDGDGATDLVSAKTGAAHFSHRGQIAGVDLMQAALTGLGELTAISYVRSSAFDNRGGDAIHDFPRVFQLVSSLLRNDGRGHSFQSSFSYSGGRFVDGELRGFARASRRDPNGATSIGFFNQVPDALAGQMASSEVRDDGGVLWSRRTVQYEVVSPVAGVTQGRSIQTDEETLDHGDALHPDGTLHTRTLTTFDDFLNVVEIRKLGDVTLTGDESRTAISHAINTTLGVSDPPVRISQFNADDQLVATSVSLYDGLPEGQIQKGNATAIVDTVEIGGATRTRSFSHDKYGNVVSATDSGGNTTQFEYDTEQAAFRVKTTDPLGHVLSNEIDPRFDAATSATDANGKTATKAFDAFGRLIQERLPGDEVSPNATRTIVYESLGSPGSQAILVKATERAGEAGTFDSRALFDGMGQVFRIESEGTGGRTVIVTTEFDDAGQIVSGSLPHFVGATAATSSYTRDVLRRTKSETNPDGASRTMTYFAGVWTEVVDRRGNVSRFKRNAFGKIVEQHVFVDGQDQTTTYQYDQFDQPVRIVDAAGETTRIRYDALQRRTSLDDPSLGHLEYRYDPNGNVVEQTDGAGRVTRFTYNAVNQLLKKILPDGKTVEMSYDGPAGTNTQGRVAKVVDAAGSLEVAYDARGNLARRRRTIEGQSYLTGYTYDSMDRPRRVIYPDGFNVTYEYNQASYVDRIVDGGGRAVLSQLDYNAAGQLVHGVFGNGVVEDEGYDRLMRLASITTVDPSGRPLQDRRNQFDAAGNVTAIDDLIGSASQSFTYDAKNQLIRAIGPWGDDRYEYDPIGNLLRKGDLFMDYDSVRKQQLGCGIDLSLLVPRGSSPGPNGPADRAAAFDACFDELKARLPSPLRDALLDARKRGPLARLAGEGFFVTSYDARGNLARKNDETYDYDDENHLLRVSRNGHSTQENVFDHAGNRVIRFDQQGNGPFAASIFIDGLFELNGAKALRHVRFGREVVATISTPAAPLQLISELQLAAVALEGVDQQRSGSACACAVGAGAGAGRSLAALALLSLLAAWARPGARRLPARRRFRRLLADAAHGSARTLRRRPGRFFIAAVLVLAQALVSGGKVYGAGPDGNLHVPEQRFYHHTDHVGSVQVLTEDDGRVVQNSVYKPFGEKLRLTGSDDRAKAVEFAYQGQRTDADTGFVDFGARLYNPVIGRFLAADSQVPDLDNPQTLHRYAFNLNNPIRFIDPTGHGFWDVFLEVLVVVLIVVAVVIIVVGAPVFGPLLVAIASGVLAGAVMGAVVGALAAGILLATGYPLTFDEFMRIWLASIFIGMLAGAGLAAGAYAAATGGSGLLSTILTGAATGGASLAVRNGPLQGRGFGDDFLKGLFVGALIGAAGSAAGYGIASYAGLSKDAIWSWGTLFAIGVSAGIEAGATKLGVVDPVSWFGFAMKILNGEDPVPTGSSSSALTATGVPAWSFPGGGGFGRRVMGGTPALNALPLAL